jgi:hypothetical protein
MIADFIMSFQRRREDKLQSEGVSNGIGRGRAHIIKNRFGPDGMTFPAKVDTSTGIIQLFLDESPDGRKINKDIDEGTVLDRQALKAKLNKLDNINSNTFLG